MLRGVALATAMAGLGLCLAWVAMRVNKEQPEPYMDEVFHVPQARQYCSHNFSHWDPMITTLPGLYMVSVLVMEPLGWLMGRSTLELCSVSGLRAVNAVFMIGCFLLLYHLTSPHPSPSSVLHPLALSSLPLLFFFSFLYYTDLGSTFFVLLGYWTSRQHHQLLSALSLLVAILFRQTNVVWVVFVAGAVALDIIEPEIVGRGGGRGGRGGALSPLWALVRAVLQQLLTLFSTLWPHLLVVVLFLVFVLINGSIVVGDKEHHHASLHLPQLLYFCSMSCGLSAGPLLLSHLKVVRASLTYIFTPHGLVMFLTLCLLGLLSVHYFTYEHPYLLADNRHYPFYLWKNVFRYHTSVKYMLVPAHCLCLLILGRVLAVRQSILWLLLFLLSCAVALVPQSLIEFRYFIIPYLFLRLHSPLPSLLGSLAELATYTLINTITLLLFLHRPFHWPGSEQLQRFMW